MINETEPLSFGSITRHLFPRIYNQSHQRVLKKIVFEKSVNHLRRSCNIGSIISSERVKWDKDSGFYFTFSKEICLIKCKSGNFLFFLPKNKKLKFDNSRQPNWTFGIISKESNETYVIKQVYELPLRLLPEIKKKMRNI